MSNVHELKRWIKAIIQGKVSAINTCEVSSGVLPKSIVERFRLPAAFIFNEESRNNISTSNKKVCETDFVVMVITENLQDRYGAGADKDLADLSAAIQNQLVDVANFMRHTAESTETIDNDVAVDKGGNKVGIPITGHEFEKNDIVFIEGTNSYSLGSNNTGTYLVDSTTANEIVIYPARYVAETFTGDDDQNVQTIEKIFMLENIVGPVEIIMVEDFENALIGQKIKLKIWHEYS